MENTKEAAQSVITTPDEVTALVKKLRAARRELEIDGVSLTQGTGLLSEAADALESLSPPAGMVMVPRDWFVADADHAGKPIWILDVKLTGETLDEALSARERKE